ncbi:hypothetical protein FC07_GL000199 [Loigolactobacillus bifermentans DSM 20003]|uniref:Uncharacterized protein n=1 Tax=Loigolactobacillus bifermentans DSM 20003 TaxID=1423726 RepID=A0A0R1GMJ8_9LACO|nr:hypothetical protein FC07_GL000199 [Loigolactobacillus bifermentans DSM 20003]
MTLTLTITDKIQAIHIALRDFDKLIETISATMAKIAPVGPTLTNPKVSNDQPAAADSNAIPMFEKIELKAEAITIDCGYSRSAISIK